MSPNLVVTSSQEPYSLVKIHFLFLSGPSGLMLPTLSTGKGMCILATKYFPLCEMLPSWCLQNIWDVLFEKAA